ncbi:MAG: hypothetical protein HC832_00570 [Leptolyngbyaceae cyanobacterium RM1_405_57]|nr:hypothetical protein [Leptolyngbyaceae cyanobacterium RM1_405_57]
MQVLTGKIKYPAGKAFASKLEGKPARQSLKITLNRSNEDIDLWFDEGRQPHCSLKKGDEVTVIRNGDRYTLAVEEDEAPPPANANDTSAATTSATGKFPSWSDEHKRKSFKNFANVPPFSSTAMCR